MGWRAGNLYVMAIARVQTLAQDQEPFNLWFRILAVAK